MTGGAAVRESGALAANATCASCRTGSANLSNRLNRQRAAFADVKARASGYQAMSSARSIPRRRILVATTREYEQQRTRLAAWLAEIERDVQRSDARASSLEQSRTEAELQLGALDGELRQLASERDSARVGPGRNRATNEPCAGCHQPCRNCPPGRAAAARDS